MELYSPGIRLLTSQLRKDKGTWIPRHQAYYILSYLQLFAPIGKMEKGSWALNGDLTLSSREGIVEVF